MAKRTVTRRALKPYINSFVGQDDDEIQEDDVITNENEDQIIVLEPETLKSDVENKEPEAVKQETTSKNNLKNSEIPF